MGKKNKGGKKRVRIKNCGIGWEKYTKLLHQKKNIAIFLPHII